MESLEEVSVYLDTDARIDLKDIALEYIRGLSGNRDGAVLISKCDKIIMKLMLLSKDSSDLVRKESILALINISAEAEGVETIVKLRHSKFAFITHLLDIILDAKTKVADSACMLLCNLTRSPENLEKCIKEITPKLPELLEAFNNVAYNISGCHLNYLGPLFSNLSGDETVQAWLCGYKGKTDNSTLGVVVIASFCHYKKSTIRRGGAAGTLRNICFDVARHNYLLDSQIDILPYLLLPLVGGEEYSDDEMDSLPSSLQFLPPDTEREVDPDIRILLLETLYRFCAKRPGREYLRKNGVYYILRELHKWEKDRKALLACENVVDILIRKEEEMETEDITAVEVPQEYNNKFQEDDEHFINDTT